MIPIRKKIVNIMLIKWLFKSKYSEDIIRKKSEKMWERTIFI